MNAFNRLVMLIVALLLVAVPVLLLLIGFEVLTADQISSYYRPALDSLGGVVQDFDFARGTRVIIAVVGILVALVAGYLLLRELAFGRQVESKALVEDAPGKETAVTAQAVRSLAEGAAREAGAASPTCRLASRRGRYEVSCDIQVPGSRNFTETATRVRENVNKVLGEQRVPVRDVEVTVRGTVSS